MNPTPPGRMLSVLICLIFVVATYLDATGQTSAPIGTTNQTASVDSVSSVPDSLRAALPDSAVNTRLGPSPGTLIFDANHLGDLDHQEFGDYVRLMPGYYPLDMGEFASPARGLVLGLSARTMTLNFRGRQIEDHLLGSPELGWIPPEALSQVDLTPLPLESPGVRVDAYLRSLESLPPASRISIRDGYYGLGNVDFDLAQKITPTVILNAGGRVTTFDGRFAHAAGYGLNVRSEIGFRISPDLSGWAGIMQNRLNSEVPFSTVNHNRERYDADIALKWHDLTADLYGYEQIETYGGSSSDFWQELGLNMGTQRAWGSVKGDFKLNLAQGRWRLKGLDWSKTSFGGANSTLNWSIRQTFTARAYLGLEVSDDFAPARHLALRLEQSVGSGITAFAGASQHQEFPSRFETAANYLPGAHFLPYDSTLYMNPNLNVQGEPGLRLETYNTFMAGAALKSRQLSASLAGFWNRTEHPIAWQVQDGIIQAFNADSWENRGLLGWAVAQPWERLEVGVTGSWLPLKNGERRLFPEGMGHAWVQVRQPLFKNQLELRWRTWADFWGERSAPVPNGWQVLPNDVIVSSRLSAYLLGVHIFWELRNIANRYYTLVPGLLMMHKEEVWGVTWNFKN